MQFQEVRFGGHAGSHRIGGLARGGLHQGGEVVVRFQVAGGVHAVELGAVGDAIELHEQAFGQPEQAGGGVRLSAGVEVEAEGLDAGQVRQAGVVTVVVQFLEGVRTILAQRTEHVDVEGLDVVLVFRSDDLSRTGGRGGGFQPQVVLQGEQYLGTGIVALGFTGDFGGLGERLAGTGEEQAAGG